MRKRVVWAAALVMLALAAVRGVAAEEPRAAHSEGAPAAAKEGHGHGEGAEEGGAGGGLFSWDSAKADLALWTGVVFLGLLFILGKYAWGPIAQGLDQREKLIADEIASAQRVNQEAKDLLASYQQKLSAAQDEVRAIHEQARRDAEQVVRGMMDKAREEAKHEQEKAVREIEIATSAALKELAERSAGMAVDLAGRIVRSRLRPEDHADLIQQAVTKFAQSRTATLDGAN